MAGGRPTLYTPELCDSICALIAEGLSLRSISKEESMPCVATMIGWLRTNEQFLLQYEKAKQEQADMLAEDILDIADDGTNDWMLRNAEDNAGFIQNGEAIQRSRLRVDARKWIASKLKPKKYGDKTTTELTGKDGGKIEVEMSDMEAAKRIAFLLAKVTSEQEGS